MIDQSHAMSECHLELKDKKKLVREVGEKLVAEHGKKKYYQPAQVKKAILDLGYQIDYACWAYCIFTSPEDFRIIHETLGEVCDYVSMKSEVLSALAPGGSFLDLDIDLSWLDWPDIDLGSVFDWVDF